MNWLTEHIEWLIAVGVLGIPSMIQISPLKINPWSYLSKKIKNMLYGEISAQINEVNAKLDGHIKKNELDTVKSSRLRILRFNDELIRGLTHTKEHFDEILEDVTVYERYCSEHEEYENAKAELSIKNIKRVYQNLEKTNGFL